jgi:hypothetical protein
MRPTRTLNAGARNKSGPISELKPCRPMGTSTANWRERRLRYVSVFGQLSTSRCLPVYGIMDVRNAKNKAVHSSAAGAFCRRPGPKLPHGGPVPTVCLSKYRRSPDEPQRVGIVVLRKRRRGGRKWLRSVPWRCNKCGGLMELAVDTQPANGDCGLLAYWCPRCEFGDSELIPPPRLLNQRQDKP